jgi:hypothetical protein
LFGAPYFPEKGGAVPELHGVQVLDDPITPALLVLGHAGFIDKNYAKQMLDDYLQLLENTVDSR